MIRFLLVLGPLVTGLLFSSPLFAQSTLDSPGDTIINKPMSPPPATARAPEGEPTLRAVRADRHAPIRFSVAPDSEKQNLRLYQERGVNAVLGPGGNRDTSEMVPLCSPPCEMSLRARNHVFGVSSGNRGAVKVDPVLRVRDGDQVVIHYNSRLPLRIVGWVLMLAGTAAGGLLLASGLPAQDPTIPARVAGGAALLGVSLGVGLWFANVPDSARGWVTR